MGTRLRRKKRASIFFLFVCGTCERHERASAPPHPVACGAPHLAGLHERYNGTADAVSKILRKEGVRGFFRGMSLPLAGTIVETSCLFSTNGALKRVLREAGHIGPNADLPMKYVMVSGAGTGFVVSWVLTPIELVKCRLQVPLAGAVLDPSLRYTGPLDCLTRSIRSEGLRVLYRGHVGTMLREVPGTMCWFGAYETFVRWMTPEGKSRAELHPMTVVVAGALGGMSYWAIMYPCDTVKSAMQITSGEPPALQGALSTAAASATTTSTLPSPAPLGGSNSGSGGAGGASTSLSSSSSAAVSTTAGGSSSSSGGGGGVVSSSGHTGPNLASSSSSSGSGSSSSTSLSSGGGAAAAKAARPHTTLSSSVLHGVTGAAVAAPMRGGGPVGTAAAAASFSTSAAGAPSAPVAPPLLPPPPLGGVRPLPIISQSFAQSFASIYRALGWGGGGGGGGGPPAAPLMREEMRSSAAAAAAAL